MIERVRDLRLQIRRREADLRVIRRYVCGHRILMRHIKGDRVWITCKACGAWFDARCKRQPWDQEGVLPPDERDAYVAEGPLEL